MAIGKVKWFNNAKGYGFILPEGDGEDLFAHYSSIEMEGYRTLKAGQDVEYERLEGPKGFHAVNIRALGAAAEARPLHDADEATSEEASIRDQEPDPDRVAHRETVEQSPS
jgi:CspA family cold shock protein